MTPRASAAKKAAAPKPPTVPAPTVPEPPTPDVGSGDGNAAADGSGESPDVPEAPGGPDEAAPEACEVCFPDGPPEGSLTWGCEHS